MSTWPMQMEAVYRLTAHRVALHCIWQHSTWHSSAVHRRWHSGTQQGILGESRSTHGRTHVSLQFHNWKSRASQLQCPAAGTPHICAWFVWLEQPPALFLRTSFSLRLFIAISIWAFSIAKSLAKFLTKTRKLNVKVQVTSDMNKIGIWFCRASGLDVHIRLSSAICPPHYPHWALLHFFLRKDLSDPINIVTLRMITLFTYYQY